ncbi:MAG: LppX_LprAFG lipoprotein [Kineosporiaceae bacterium]
MILTRLRSPLAPGAVLLLLGGLAVAGCSGSDDSADPAGLLERSREVLAATDSVHFVLTSSDVPDGATALRGGEGDAARPDRFAGDLEVSLAGVAATVAVVSIDGTLYAQLPLTTGFTETDPATIGIADPGDLLAADGGIDGLLAAAQEPTDAGEARVDGTVVRQVEVTIPAAAVAEALTAADGAGEFAAVIGVDPATGQLRRAELTGPFLAPDTDSTYVIELSDYDEPVEITAPAT